MLSLSSVTVRIHRSGALCAGVPVQVCEQLLSMLSRVRQQLHQQLALVRQNQGQNESPAPMWNMTCFLVQYCRVLESLFGFSQQSAPDVVRQFELWFPQFWDFFCEIDGLRINCDENRHEATRLLLRILSGCSDCQRYIYTDEHRLLRIFSAAVTIDGRKDALILYNQRSLPYL
jgi:hypothetical protein